MYSGDVIIIYMWRDAGAEPRLNIGGNNQSMNNQIFILYNNKI